MSALVLPFAATLGTPLPASTGESATAKSGSSDGRPFATLLAALLHPNGDAAAAPPSLPGETGKGPNGKPAQPTDDPHPFFGIPGPLVEPGADAPLGSTAASIAIPLRRSPAAFAVPDRAPLAETAGQTSAPLPVRPPSDGKGDAQVPAPVVLPKAAELPKTVTLAPAAAPPDAAHATVRERTVSPPPNSGTVQSLIPVPTIAPGEAPLAGISPMGGPAAPIVIETGATPMPQASGPLDPRMMLPAPHLQVAEAIKLRPSERTIELALNPPDLGRVRIDFDYGQDGVLRTVLHVEESETLHLLRRQAPALLKELLSLNLGQPDLQFTDRSNREEQAGWFGSAPPDNQSVFLPPIDDHPGPVLGGDMLLLPEQSLNIRV